MAYVSSLVAALLTSVIAFARPSAEARVLPGDQQVSGDGQYATSMCLGS